MNQPNELRLYAHRLIDRISRNPGAIKLLLEVIPTLELYANYKSNRRKQNNVAHLRRNLSENEAIGIDDRAVD
ncbi:hypothetical protein [Leptolyngbya sp. FACHB-17]|uniref:hypothetical protein n=1 Tax=unclassified Leptolyngbya TaxID=2650499 RepID=UPI0016811558|nr:hypothetical protein [Leptolyngbya sp. FACHB-17]MBD2079325.1 hypothetical protein [Leptolyngbya sp. FACHB-17]